MKLVVKIMCKTSFLYRNSNNNWNCTVAVSIIDFSMNSHFHRKFKSLCLSNSFSINNNHVKTMEWQQQRALQTTLYITTLHLLYYIPHVHVCILIQYVYYTLLIGMCVCILAVLRKWTTIECNKTQKNLKSQSGWK